MFKFLKEKLKNAVSKFSKDVAEKAEDIEEPVEEPVPEPVKEVIEKKPKPAKKRKPKDRPKEKETAQDILDDLDSGTPEPEEEKVEEPVPEPEPEPEPEPVPEPEPEEEKKEETEPELGPELLGLKEALDAYSDDDLGSILSILGFDPDTKQKSKGEKVKLILTKPILEVNSAVEKLDEIAKELEVKEEPALEPEKVAPSEPVEEAEPEPAPEDVERVASETEEEREEELLATEQEVEDDREEEILEAEKDVEKDVEEEEKEEKKGGGFLKRVFGFGKKKEEPEEAEQPEGSEESEVEEQKPGPEEEETPVPMPEELEKEEDAELKELDKEKEKTLVQVSEEDKELEKEEKDLEEVQEAFEKEKEPEPEPEKKEEKKGFFGKLTAGLSLKKLSESKFEDIFFDLEVALLENNVAVEVIEKIKQDLHVKLVDQKVKRSQIEEIVISTLRDSLGEILSVEPVDLLGRVAEKRKDGKPLVMVFVGINGSGKTTTIAKLAKYFMDNDLKPVLVAADTFRAAAIQQLEEHANNLAIKMIKHDYGSDPAAVAFDGIKYAEAKGLDVVMIDTAGRLHSNINLMDEMKKIIRVSNPDMKIFIGESITGNDCIEQAQKFDEAIDIDGIVLSKADVDEKGGAAISVSYVTGKPILFLGTGQTYDSLQKFDKNSILSNLGLD